MTDYQEMIEAVNAILKADRSPILTDDEEGIVFSEFNIAGQRDAQAIVHMVWMERREDA